MLTIEKALKDTILGRSIHLTVLIPSVLICLLSIGNCETETEKVPESYEPNLGRLVSFKNVQHLPESKSNIQRLYLNEHISNTRKESEMPKYLDKRSWNTIYVQRFLRDLFPPREDLNHFRFYAVRGKKSSPIENQNISEQNKENEDFPLTLCISYYIDRFLLPSPAKELTKLQKLLSLICSSANKDEGKPEAVEAEDGVSKRAPPSGFYAVRGKKSAHLNSH